MADLSGLRGNSLAMRRRARLIASGLLCDNTRQASPSPPNVARSGPFDYGPEVQTEALPPTVSLSAIPNKNLGDRSWTKKRFLLWLG